MIAPALVPEHERTGMYAAMQRRYEGLSLPKFLQARDDDDAQQRWFSTIEEFVGRLPSGVFVSAGVINESPALTFTGGIVLSIDVWRLRDEDSAGDRWNITMVPAHVPVLIDAVGWALWGAAWSAALARAVGPVATPRLVAAQGADATGWFVDGGTGPATLLWFEDRARGERALRAFVAGSDTVAAEYRQMAEAGDG